MLARCGVARMLRDWCRRDAGNGSVCWVAGLVRVCGLVWCGVVGGGVVSGGGVSGLVVIGGVAAARRSRYE